MKTRVIRKKAKSITANRRIAVVVFIVAFSALGLSTLMVSHAATSATSSEAESGVLAGAASAVSDSSASNGQAVRFGTSSSSTYSCTRTFTNDLPDDWTSDTANNPQGTCHYGVVPYVVTGDTDDTTFVGQNVGGAPPPHFVQTLHANSVRDWYVTVNEASDDPTQPNANGGVHNYPNLGFWMHGRVDDFKTISTSYNVTIPQQNSVAGWAAYDLWFNDDDTEVMITGDFGAYNYYDCTSVATATFSGQPWHMCAFGDERVWKRGTDDAHITNKASDTINIKEILTWMESHTFVDPDTHITRQQLAPGSVWQTGYNGASFGFEVPSTSGQNKDFRVNDFSWTATR